MTAFGFPKQERLRSSSEFKSLSARGRKIHTRSFLILVLATDGHPRLGVTVSRKVGNAVVRNRVKRYLREYFRHHKGLFKNADYNIIARKGASTLDFCGVCAELDRALQAPLA